MDASTSAALQKLLDDPATTAAVLPIVAKWDKAGALAASSDRHGKALVAELGNAKAADDRRAALAASLLAVPARRPEALAVMAPMLSDAAVSDALKTRLITVLGESAGSDVDDVLVATLARTPSTPIFDQIARRPEAALALLAAMKGGKVTPASLGPANVARLRTHPNRQVARQAAALLETLSPAGKAKGEIIAALTPEVEKPGDAAKGRELFTGACATCHKLGALGKSEVGPPLNGMGAHGRAALLAQIIDPNREVDPSFWQWNVTTKNGQTLTGVIASENAAGITLRNANGDVQVKKEEIAARENTRLSLMPEGLEALGGEALRDILSFMVSASAGEDQKYRILDLRGAYTADSRRGLRREDERDETVTLHRFGDVTVAGVPFFVMDPARSPNGANLVALKGGPGTGIIADELPQRVEIPTTVTAASLHFLGGVGGWAWPTGGDDARGKPALKVLVQFADGRSEEHVLNNGEHIADTFTRAEVPRSTDAGDFTRRGQLRYFALNLARAGTLTRIVLESFDSDVVPVTVAITASAEPAGTKPAPAAGSGQAPSTGPKEGGKGDAPLPETRPVVWAPGKTKVLIIAGGSSHNFGQFFGATDGATLTAAGFSVNYTEDRDQAAAELANADVAVVSVNRQFFDTPAYRKALFDFAAAGKGLVMLHPGTWYGFAQWPELNATIVGGGARGHDRIAAFSVNAVKPEHPVMKGVPASFTVEDELYYLNAEPEKVPQGTAAIDVLAETSPSLKFKKPHPAVWVTSHPTARIVGITLGHDQRVHDLEPFKTLLVNAVRWVGGAKP
jgi:putative heme-binding domain-containing protein